MNWRSTLFRLTLVLILIGVAAAGSVIWREYERSERIQEEIDTLKREADRIRRENEGLTEKIRYFSSPDFQEREAKEKLGFRRLEEEVIVLQGGGDQLSLEPVVPPPALATQSGTPNYRKWWALFFHR